MERRMWTPTWPQRPPSVLSAKCTGAMVLMGILLYPPLSTGQHWVLCICRPISCHFTACWNEPCLADLVNHLLLMSAVPSDSYSLYSPSSAGFPDLRGEGLAKELQFRLCLHNIWLWDSASVPICCWGKPFWWWLNKGLIYECSIILRIISLSFCQLCLISGLLSL